MGKATRQNPEDGANQQGAFEELVDRLNEINSREQLEKELRQVVNDSKLYQFLDVLFDGELFCIENASWSLNTVPVGRLLPTCGEFGLGGPPAFPLTSQCDVKQFFQDNVTIAGFPIIVYEGNFIIDGHRRWSQVYMLDKRARMRTINLSSGMTRPWRFLSRYRPEPAGGEEKKRCDVGEGEGSSSSVYDMDKSEIVRFVEFNMEDSFWKKVCEYTDCTTRDDVTNRLVNNILDMKAFNPPCVSSRVGADKAGAKGTR